MDKINSPLLELRKFVAPEFVFGVGARALVGRYLANFGARKVLLVTDENLEKNTDWVCQVEESFKAYELPHVIFNRVSPNPRAEEVMAGAALFSEHHCNCIVAFGGGSAMDCAKGIGIVSSNGGHILEFEGVDKIRRAMPPLICIPSTSGTASEVSQFSIILDETRKRKIAIVSKAGVPDVGLVDPEVTATMDAYLTACTGMDALTHAFEAYVSNASSPITDLHAFEAIRIIHEALPKVISEPLNIHWRARMLLGSLQAGLAFSNAILGAVHAMAHSLGGYLDLPHGECNAILLGAVVEHNYSVSKDKYDKIAEIFGIKQADLTGRSGGRILSRAIGDFRRELGITKSLRDLGVDKSLLGALAENALHDACLATNPRQMTKRDLEVVYEQAF